MTNKVVRPMCSRFFKMVGTGLDELVSMVLVVRVLISISSVQAEKQKTN